MRFFRTFLSDFEVKRFCNTWEFDCDAFSAISEASSFDLGWSSVLFAS